MQLETVENKLKQEQQVFDGCEKELDELTSLETLAVNQLQKQLNEQTELLAQRKQQEVVKQFVSTIEEDPLAADINTFMSESWMATRRAMIYKL